MSDMDVVRSGTEAAEHHMQRTALAAGWIGLVVGFVIGFFSGVR